MPRLQIFELGSDSLEQAWPLVRVNLPQLRPEGWQTFAREIIDRGGGVMAVAGPSDTLQGIATYEALPKPKFGRVLHVSTLVTFELSSRSPVRALLLTALKLRSRALGCSELVISSRRRPPSRLSVLRIVQ